MILKKSCRLRSTHNKGYTLIELLTVVAVVIISTSVAFPGYSRLVSSNLQTASINQFSTSLAQARYYAVTNMRPVVLCPSSNQQDCTGGFEWQNGYISFVDLDRDKQHDNNEKIIAIHGKQSDSVKILTSTGRRKIAFRPTGDSSGSNVTVRFCSDKTNLPGKALILSNTGRARLARKMPKGGKISCQT